MSEFGDAGSGGDVVHRAVLERVVVALDGRLGVGDLGGDGVEFGVSVGVGVVELLAGFGDDLVQDGVGVGVEVVQGLQDGGVGGVGGEPDSVAAGGAVAVAGKAGVVAVAGVAAPHGGADVLASAVGTGDQPG
ncbi:hypothetical protein ABZ738_24080 [Micromonospora sp. NPDC047793]|uniref:hypothetical protein n=1 Tax=Micromonospora sp. NPDC047793 TaxID=3154342 RepID=UPI0033D4A5F3